MNDLSGTPELTVFIPAETAQGRRCLLTLRAGAVWDAKGTPVALEMLSEIRDRQTGERLPADAFFARVPAREQLRILHWQLDVLRLHQSWCRSRGLRISLNISRPLAISMLTDPTVARKISRLRDILRLELSEYFISPGAGGCDSLVEAMGELAPLWLDDFGCGTTPYECLTEGCFEAVKVDRGFVERLYRQEGGGLFLQGLSALLAGSGTQLIAEGIADRALWAFVNAAGATASQGWLWPELYLSGLESLPVQLPV